MTWEKYVGKVIFYSKNMKRTFKSNIKEILYFIGFFLMGLSAVVIGNSYLFGTKRFQICTIVQYIAIIIFLTSFCVGKYKLMNLITVMLLGVATFLSAVVTHNLAFALFGLSIATSVRIDARKIVKNSVINNGIFLAIVIIPAMLGWIPDDIYYHGNMTAHCLGFAYYSNAPYIVLMGTIAIYWLIRSKKLERLFLVFSIPVHILVYKICTVRLTLYVYIIFLVFVLAANCINTKKQHKCLTWIATLMYPVMAALVFWASFKYRSSSILTFFNKIINYRLMFNLQGFEQYGVKLFGQQIRTSQEYIDENFINHYFYIDCGYVYMLIGYGLIIFTVIMILYILVSRYAMKNNNIKLISWCFTVCIFSVINNIMLNTALNPLPILGINLLWSNNIATNKKEIDNKQVETTKKKFAKRRRIVVKF